MMARLFDLVFVLAAPFWLLMIVAPGWSWTRRIIGSPLIVVPAALLYVAVVATVLPDIVPAVLSPDLAGVQALLATPAGATAAWAHFIAFDLFVGRWMYLDSRERGVHPLIMAPVLVVTILLAPVGLLAYLALRPVASRKPAAQAVPTA